MEKRQRMVLLGIAAAIAIAAVAIALVAGGDDGDSSQTTAATPSRTQATQERSPQAEPEVAAIRVRDGEPVGGVEEIAVQKGDTVRIDVTSDTADALHLHVYDIEKQLQPGKPTRLRFEADVEGVVELELHGSGNRIAEITVEP